VIEIFIKNNDGSKRINNTNLFKFLSEHGFAIMSDGNGTVLVKIQNNIAERASESDMIICVKNHLEAQGDNDGLEIFIKGVNGYIQTKKLNFLKSVSSFTDRDTKEKSTFYFRNCFVEVTSSSIDVFNYTDSDKVIWKERIIDRDFNLPDDYECQFKEFMNTISKKDSSRYDALKSMMGYLLHRYNNQSLTKAVILMDENPQTSGAANGGTGKGLLTKAIEKCREIVTVNGQQTKANSRFNNQRIENTTDIIHYDDVKSNFNLDEIKSLITSGVVVEQKGKKEVLINPEDAPKFLISTNYTVLGPGGSTDRRRRYEFELANHYNDKHRPIDEFGNLFFEEWNEEEWNKFYLLMLNCVKDFLKNGLIECDPINIDESALANNTCSEFSKFANKQLIANTRYNKTELFQKFKKEYQIYANIAQHIFTKWLKQYAVLNHLDYEDKSSGGIQSFILKRDEEDEKE
jgi:hypothetical protein